MSTNEHANWCSHERAALECDCPAKFRAKSKPVKTKLWMLKSSEGVSALYALTNDKMRMVAITKDGHIGSWIDSSLSWEHLFQTEGKPIVVNNFKEI